MRKALVTKTIEVDAKEKAVEAEADLEAKV
jgi:hypothetical protein